MSLLPLVVAFPADQCPCCAPLRTAAPYTPELSRPAGHPEWSAAAEDPYAAAVASDYAKVSPRLCEYPGYRPGPPPPQGAVSPHESRTPPGLAGAASAPSMAAPKKHQLFGRRYFPPPVDGGYGAAAAAGAVGPVSPAPLKYGSYGAEGGGPPAPEAAGGLNSPELKYSCSLDFARALPGDRMGLVAHNHSYHLPPHAHSHVPSGGPSGSRLDKPDERPRDHVTRDEKRARAMSIPISTEDIVHLPMDEFNERLSKHDLTEPQLSLIRDIRRRGKNKLAAQNCRKRKLDQILSLAEEVRLARDQRQRTLSEHQRLCDERARVKDQYAQLYRHVFQALRDPDGRPYSPLEYSLQQSADGSVLLVPRAAAAAAGATVDPETGGARRKTRDPHRPD